eukprot:4866853-Amphidinium_carterae.1
MDVQSPHSVVGLSSVLSCPGWGRVDLTFYAESASFVHDGGIVQIERDIARALRSGHTCGLCCTPSWWE